MHEASNFRKLVEFGVKLPWPLAHRSFFVAASATDIQDEDTYLMVFKSLEGNTYMKNKKVVKNERKVEVDVHYAGVYLERIGPNRTRMRAIFNADPKMAMPRQLINHSFKLILLVIL